MDLLCRFLLEPGDTVLVDDPCYFNFQALLRAHRAKIVSVPYTPSGPDIELFADGACRASSAALHHQLRDPQSDRRDPVSRDGTQAAQARRPIRTDHHRRRSSSPISNALPAPRLAAFDGLDRVIHIGSFSKTISASVRCGFVAARPEWIEGLIDLKIATSFGGGRLNAELVLAVLSDGGYRRHMETLRGRLASAMSNVAGKLKAIGIEPWLMPEAGMFLWCRLPDDVDAADLARAAVAENVVLAPGNAFSVSQSAGNFVRFNVSQTLDARIFEVLRRSLARARKSGS